MATFGETLRQARVYKGVSLKEVEQATRINRQQLAALEEHDFDILPALIYQRGIVRNYAVYLGLDPNRALSLFDEARGVSPEVDVVAATKPLDMPSHWAPNFAIIAFMVVISAIVFAWLYSAYFAPGEAMPTATTIIPTVTPVASSERSLPTATVPPPTETPKAKPTAKPKATKTATSEPTAADEPEATAEPEVAAIVDEPTEEPTDVPVEVEPTEEVVVPTEEPTEEPVPTEEPTEEVVVEEPTEAEPTPEAREGEITIEITALDGIELTVIAEDGTSLYEGFLAAGSSTGPMSAQSFEVATSDPDSTQVTRAGGDPFFMGSEFFELP